MEIQIEPELTDSLYNLENQLKNYENYFDNTDYFKVVLNTAFNHTNEFSIIDKILDQTFFYGRTEEENTLLTYIRNEIIRIFDNNGIYILDDESITLTGLYCLYYAFIQNIHGLLALFIYNFLSIEDENRESQSILKFYNKNIAGIGSNYDQNELKSMKNLENSKDYLKIISETCAYIIDNHLNVENFIKFISFGCFESVDNITEIVVDHYENSKFTVLDYLPDEEDNPIILNDDDDGNKICFFRIIHDLYNDIDSSYFRNMIMEFSKLLKFKNIFFSDKKGE